MIKILSKFFALSIFLVSNTLLAVSAPTVSNSAPSENFVGEGFCFSSEFTNSSVDIGYGPYYQLILNPDFTFSSADFSGLGVTVVSNSVFPGSGELTDPISETTVTGTDGGQLVILGIPVGSVSSSQAPLSVEICLDLDVSATPNVLQSNAISIVPGFQFGDTATGTTGVDTVLGTADANNFTPRIITYSVNDTLSESENPPGPAWTFPITAVANIAADRTVTPITFPTITLPGNVKFVGPINISGGTGCSFTPNEATLSANSGLGSDVTIDVSCTSGTGTIGSSQDIVVDFDIYITDTLDSMTCNSTGAINTAKHLVLRKGASGTGVPGSTITYTYSYQTSEFIPGLDGFTVSDTLEDGISYLDNGSGEVVLSINHEGVATTLNVPIGTSGTDSVFTNADILAAITSAGGSINAAESGTITYQAAIDQTYNNGDSVLTRDVISNSVTATYGISGAGNAQNCPEGSSASVGIQNVSISKATIGTTTVMPGDVLQFRLTMNIPSGDADDIEFTDVLPLPIFKATDFPPYTGDLDLYPGSAVAGNFIEYSSGSFEPTSVTVTPNAASNSLTLSFGDIATTSAQTIIIDIYAKATTDPYSDGLTLANLFNATTDNSDIDSSTDNTATQILVRAPDVEITKEITSPLNAPDASDQIDYLITLENVGGADSYDVTVTDTFGTGIDSSSCTAPVISGGSGAYTGTLSGGLTLSNSLAGSGAALGSAGSGNEVATLTFSCDLETSVAAGVTITNTASVVFSADVGATAFPTTESAVDIVTRTPTVTKSLVTTSEADTGFTGIREDIAIGEIARFRLEVELPEGTNADVDIVDLLPSRFIYLDDGTATIAFVSDGSNISSSSYTAPGGCTLNSTSQAVVPDCVITAPGSPFTAGEDPVFSLGTVANTDSDANEEYLIVEFNAYKTDSSSGGIFFSNSGRLVANSTNYSSNSLLLRRVEPVLTLDKQSDSTMGDAGDAINYDLVITAPASSPATAFEVTLTDILPTELTYQAASGSFSGCPVSATTSFDDSDPNGTGINLDISELAAGETCTFSYSANLNVNAVPGDVVTNTATLEWTSLLASGSSLATSSPGPEKTYTTDDSIDVMVDGTASVKSIVSTSQSHTSESGTGASGSPRLVSIGETLKYRLEVNIPEGTANNFVVRDNLPDGLEFVVSSAAIAFVSDGGLSSSNGSLCTSGTLNQPEPASGVTPDCVITPTLGASGNSVDFDLSNLSNADSDSDDETLVIEFDALVLNQLSNQQNVTLANSFEVLLSGSQNSISTTVDAEVVEPQLSLSATTSPDPVDNRVALTPTVGWTIVLTNNGLAQAFQIQDGDSGNWQIQMPAGVESITSLNISTSGNVVLNSDLVTSITTSNFSVSGAANNLLSIDDIFSIEPGASLTIAFDTTLDSSITPGASLTNSTDLDYASQQTGDPTQDVRDFSDISTGTGNDPVTGTGAPLNNYRLEADITLDTVTSVPLVGVAKDLVSSTFVPSDGTFNLLYRFYIENSGDVNLETIQITDDLASVFNPDASYSITSLSAVITSGTGTIDANDSAFDGSSDINLLVASNTTLEIGATATIDLALNVAPGSNLRTYNNSAEASAVSVRDSGNTVTDDSVNGTDPDPEADGPGDNTSVTPVTFTVNPEISVAKAINGPIVNNQDNTYTLNYRFIVKNTGDVDLNNVQLIDDLDATFSGASYSIPASNPTSSDLTINTSYDGSSDTNLLAASQSLTVDATATIDLQVIVTPGANLGPYSNTAIASATSPNGNPADDNSDNGSDPETDNGSGGSDDATLVTFTEAPNIGVAKAVTAGPTNNGDGTYNLSYSLVVQNTGDVILTNVQVADDLATIFAGASFSVSSISASTLTTNGSFDGSADTDLLAGSQSLAVGASDTIVLNLVVTPGSNLGPYNNQATASGDSPSGAGVSDLSDAGSDPTTDNGSGGSDDVTPVTFTEAPSIGVAKAVTAGPTNNGDGTYNLSYSLVVQNTGDVNLTNVQVADNLATTFAGASFSVSSISASTLTTNGSFDGSADADLLAGSQSLAVGASDTIVLNLVVTPGSNLGPYNNQATASGDSPSGAGVSDLSDAGSDPTTDNGSGGSDDVTPVTFTEAPSIGVAKAVTAGPTNNGDGTYNLSYSLVVQNTGDVNLTNVQVADNLATTFAGASFSVSSISASTLTTNGSFDGSADADLLAGSQSLAVGASDTIVLNLVVTPGSNLGPYNNQATASGDSPSGAGVSDLSDAGSDPTTDNGSGGSDDVTPVTFTEAPSIGVAKAVTAGPTNNGDGTYNLSYSLVVQNTGDVNLTNVQVADNLATTFAGASFSVSSISASTLTTNGSFDGSADADLLAGSQSLAVGASDTIVLNLVVTPGSNLGPYNNQATASGDSPSGAGVSDLSDAGSDPTTDNGSGGNDDVTPVTFTEAPSIGVAKAVTAGPTNNGDGTYNLSYSLVVQNTGDVNLTNVQVADNLATTFAGASFSVSSISASTLTTNGSYDGSADADLLAGSQSLAVGASDTIVLNLVVTPGSNLGPYNNQATASGDSPSGAGVSDLSDAGGSATGDNGAGTDQDPTPVNFSETPSAAIAKELSSPAVNNGDGSYDLSYRIVIKNTGDIVLNAVQIVEDLTTTFPSPASFSNIVVSSSDKVVNAGFNGDSDNNLLATNQTLVIGEAATVDLQLTVSPASNLGPYNNTAILNATSPGGTVISDNSDDGSDPETDNGSGGTDDPTPVTFTETPSAGIAKELSSPVTNNGDGSYDFSYRFVIKNNGDIVLNNIQIVEDLNATFPTPASITNIVVSSSDLTVNSSFDGDSDTSLLSPNQTFVIDQTATVDLQLTIIPSTNLGPYNNTAVVNGTSPSGTTATDNSDNGSDPETDNGSGGSDDVTPVTFTEAPSIGVAKAVTAGPTNNGDGTYNLSYSLVVQNTGDVNLTNVQVADNLATTFAGASFSVSSISASTLTTNGSFDGSADADLLAGSQSLAVGASDTIVLNLVVTPGSNLGPYNNQATASGDSPSGAGVSDLSDAGSDPTTDNGSGGSDDVTPVTFTEAPNIGVAKAVTAGPTNNGDGTYNLSYSLVVQNTGDVILTNVQVADDLATIFAGASFSVSSISASTLTTNGSFDGSADTDLLAGSQSLAVGASDTIVLNLVVTPGSNLGPYNNQATASGDSPSGAGVSDLSDAGSDPTTDNGSGGSDDVTPVTFTEAPSIGVAKAVTAGPTNNGDGTYNLSYSLVVQNTGDVNLTNVQVADNLATTFAGASFSVSSISASTLTTNGSFDGSADADLLAGSQSLAVGASDTIVLNLVVTPGSNLGPYNNQATASGDSPSGAGVSDLSDAGSDPTTDNGSGGSDDVTPVTFTEAPSIGVAKAVTAGPTNNGDGTYNLSYSLVVQNTGDVNLTNVQVADNLATTFAGASFSVSSISASTLTTNGSFDGSADADLLAGSQSLAVGASDTIVLNLVVTPGSNLGPYNNQATASGDSPSGAGVSDLSDAGSDPTTDNGSGGSDDVTPVTFTEAPSIGVAKAVTAGPTNNGDGTYNLSYSLVVQNTGDVNLTNVQVADNLATTFAGASFSVSSISASTLTTNGSFDGSADADLLAGSQSLAVGASDTIVLNLVVTPGSNLGPYNNQATASGDSPSGAGVSDLSDAGSDPTTDNGSGGSDDVTPVTFTEAPSIGVAKAVTAGPTNNGDGTYNLSYSLVVQNTGDVNLTNVQVADNLATTFAGASFSVSSISASTLTTNGSYDGSADADLLAGSQSLAVGASDTIVLNLVVTPGSNLGPYNNQATASGDSPSGAGVSDLSDAGSDPTTDNGSGGSDDVTPVTFIENPRIGIAKTVSGPIEPTVNGTSGNFDVPFRLVIENIGDVVLNNLQIVDDLAAQLGITYVSISEAPQIISSTADVDPNISSSFPANLFDGSSGIMTVGQQLTVEFTIEVDPATYDSANPLTNQAEAQADSPASVTVTDLSDSGSNPSDEVGSGGNNSGAPGDTGGTDDPTPFVLPTGAIAGTVWIDANTNDEFDSDETLLTGWSINVYDLNGNLIATVMTDENGFFSVTNLPQGEYMVEVVTPNGTTFSQQSVIIPASETVNVPIPVDPSGVVYDSVTRVPVPGSLVTLVDTNGNPIPDQCLLPGQQNQVTGSDGFYFFLLLLDAAPACPSGGEYVIQVTAPVDSYQPGPSQLISQESDSLDPTGLGNPYSVGAGTDAPAIGVQTTYFMQFILSNGDPDVINNHIPVDQIGVEPNLIRLTKVAEQDQVVIGDLVRYRITIENLSPVDLTDLTIVDQIPAGFNYVIDSAAIMDADNQLIVTSRQPLTFDGVDVSADSSSEIVYILRVGAGVARGEHVNRVSPYLGTQNVGNEASAAVRVGADPDFEEITILGKVFDDRDADNWQDSATATNVFVQGGYNEKSYVKESTSVIRNGVKTAIPDKSSPMTEGIMIGELLGRNSLAELSNKHHVVIRQELSELDFNDTFSLMTAEGTKLIMDALGTTQRVLVGELEEGRGAQDIRAYREVALLANGNYQVDYIIKNVGIQELGVPGVRVATLTGLLTETDLHGRFHLAAVDVENFARGRNFFMKLDMATLPKHAEVLSENPRVKRVTQGVPARFDFAVKLPLTIIDVNDSVEFNLAQAIFEKDEVTIKSKYKPLIEELAQTINQHSGADINILSAGSNQRLALHRAHALRELLFSHVNTDLQTLVVMHLKRTTGSSETLISVGEHITLGSLIFENSQQTIRESYSELFTSLSELITETENGLVRIPVRQPSNSNQNIFQLDMDRARTVLKRLRSGVDKEKYKLIKVRINSNQPTTQQEAR